MSRNVVSCTQPGGHGNDFELIPRVQMESQHSVGWPTCHHFPRFVIISEISQPEVRRHWRRSPKSGLFGKKSLYGQIFKNCFPKGFTTSRIHVLCDKFRKIWLTGNQQSRALFTLFTWQKETKISARSTALASVQIAPKICQGSRQYTQSAPNSSNSIHFRRSYSRTREHRWNVPQSVSNTRRSFFTE